MFCRQSQPRKARDRHRGRVTFWHKDHRHDKVWRRTSLPGVEFLRRFCAHVLPRGFVRIRPFGFLANCHRAEKLALIRRLLAFDQAASKLLLRARRHRL